MTDDRNGGFWVMANQGLFRIAGGKITPYDQTHGLPRDAVDVYQDSTETLWFTTNSGGLFRLRDSRLQAIPIRGLSNSVFLRLLDDGRGSLWISSHQGILRLSLKELNDLADGRLSSIAPVSYGIGEGMRSSDCNWGNPGIWRTTDGRIWFPTVRGVVAIDPDGGYRLPPSVVLEEAWANKVALRRDGRTSAAAGNNTFDFQFTALSFSAPERLRFKYRLESHDRDWVDAGAQRTAHYTNMAPGEYWFHVTAASGFGIWNDQGTSVRFVLRPHLYQTSVFYALCAGAWVALLCAAYLYRVQHLQRAFNMRLHERLEERTRIARDLHDTLLQSFHGSLLLFAAARDLIPRRPEEAVKRIDAAISKAADAVGEGRDAIQNLRLGSAQSRLEDLLTAAGQGLRNAQENDRAVFFQLSREGRERNLSPVLQDDIYRIAHEVLRNAFQHADARRIEAVVQYDPDLFRLRIRDDGKGIDPKVLREGTRPGHFGLLGIRERAEQIGAQLKVWSEIGAGTEVELTLPARLAYATPHRHNGLRLFRKRR
jgi:signal transduction histidine kinase